MQARFNFWTPSLLVVGMLLFFWGTSLIKVFSSPDAFSHYPSSYDKDAKLPVQDRMNNAKTPRLLVEFYQDSCVTCQQVAPLLFELSEQKSFQRCLSVLPIDADKAENRLYVDLFKVTKVPAFFIFEPRAMKKTTVPLLEGLAEAGETTTNVIKQVIQKSLKQHDPKHNCSI
ncbi:MAG: thioredoxin domain-containing protein [Vampirovibrionales bacterium]|jgi:thiol-disulfide isomerase/thioredoxin|nr:thioredoxin domain-containing protein [Vampirovibrionales bacterium]